MAPPEITLTTLPDEADLAALRAAFRAFERSRLPDLPDESEDLPVAAFVRAADGTLEAGVQANVYWDGLEIELLWVTRARRRSGLGAALVRAVERFARERGAVVAFLKTVEARGFYERLGYEVYGVLEDRPIGTRLYHMKKRLDR